MLSKWLIGLVVFSVGYGCTAKIKNTPDILPYSVNLPEYFPKLPVPEKNPMSNAKVLLGARLFYDPALSSNAEVSCASCHLPQYAFTDRRDKSFGVSGNPTVRNSPALINLAFQPYYMFDGGIPTLELQPVAPIMHPDEMGFDLFEAVNRLKNNDAYQALSQAAFGDSFTVKNLAYALAAFQRDLLSYQSPWDDYLQGNESAFSEQQKRGEALFFSDSLNCAACHSDFNFSDFGFYNIGLHENYADKGRQKVTEDKNDNGKFKTPTLRNIELTGPYMHDGSIETLAGVIDFKMSGGVENPIKSDKMKPFSLNDSDKKALIAFLNALTDREFIARELERKNALN